MVHIGQKALVDEVVHGLEGEPRIDGAHAVADKQREVVHLARLTGFEHEADAGAQAFANEIVVQAGDGEQRRDGREIFGHSAVGEDEHVDLILLNELARGGAQIVHRLGEAFFAASGAEQGGQHVHLEAGELHAADLAELLVGDDGPIELDTAAGRRSGRKQVALGTEAGLGGGDDFLADTVNRRVRDLREELLEIIVEQARLVREDGEGRVVAHRADRLNPVAGHGGEDDALVFMRVAKGELALLEGVPVGRSGRGGCGQVVEVDEVLVEPLAVGALGGEATLDFLVLDDATLRGVHEEHAAGLEPALMHNALGRQIKHAGLGGEDDEVVLGHVVARGAQAVAIEHGTDELAVGEGDVGRAVPRLHEAGVVLIEGLARVVHGLVVGPRLGDHHHHRVRERAAGEVEQLQRVIEHRGVAAIGVDDGQDLFDVVAEGLALEQRFAGVHPVDVAAEGVDLAVMRDVAVRVGAIPAGEGVGRETRVDNGERRRHRGVLQVGKIRGELRGEQHALVDDGAGGKAGLIPELPAVQAGGADFLGGALADDVELALKGEVVLQRGVAADEHLPNIGLADLGGGPKGRIVGRHRAPAEKGQPLALDDLGEFGLQLAALGGVARHEHEARAILANAGQRDALLLTHFHQKGVRHLQEHAGAVAGIGLAAGGATMVEVFENLDRLAQDLVRRAALHVHDEADAAGVVLKPRVVEALLGRAGVAGSGGRAGHWSVKGKMPRGVGGSVNGKFRWWRRFVAWRKKGRSLACEGRPEVRA